MKRIVTQLFLVAAIGMLGACASTSPKVSPWSSLVVSLRSDSVSVVEGQSVRLHWRVLPNGRDSVEVALDGRKVSLNDSAIVTPVPPATTYQLRVSARDTTSFATVTVKTRKAPPAIVVAPKKYGPDDVSNGPDDGRFTLGCRGQRLTYGFPAPFSTSHIILKVNGSYATNSARLSSTDSIHRISGNAVRTGRTGYNSTTIPFRFFGVDILQRVVPVDRDFREIMDEGSAVYYKISWQMTNRQSEPVNIGLSFLLDTMIDDNDAAKIQADATYVSTETQFVDQAVPRVCSVYRRDYDGDDLTGLFIAQSPSSLKPQQLIVGRWPYLHGLVWPIFNGNFTYTDSAIMTTWEDLSIKPDSSAFMCVYYGTKQGHPLIMLDNNEQVRSEVRSLYYDLADIRLDAKTEQAIAEMVRGKRIYAASVTGFSDAQGDDEHNLRISRERADRVVRLLQRAGVPVSAIMVKSYGESHALQSEDAIANGNASDRRVELNVWYE